MLLAERLGAEIVTVDSIKVYRGLDIGTAKATPAQRARVRHHCLDLAEPHEAFSTGKWLEAAVAAIADITGRGKTALLVGGTALYLKCLSDGMLEEPAADSALRERLNAEADRLGTPALHDRLRGLDPAAAARIHPNDRKRIVRALEVHGLTGKPLTEHQGQWAAAPRLDPPTVFGRDAVWLKIDRSVPDIRERIAMRVRRMFEAGLVAEVRGLLSRPGGLGHTAAQALAYREVIEHLAGRLGLADAERQTVDHTRQFAKRQRTWFRKFGWLRRVTVGPADTAEGIAGMLERELAAASSGGH